MMERRKHSSKNSSDTQPASPTLDGEPHQSKENALHECEIGTIHSPDHASVNWESDVPFSANISIRDSDGGDDKFSDDCCDHGLPY